MFKSVFSRYLTVFWALITICFTVIIIITAAMVNRHGVDTQRQLMDKSAYLVQVSVETINAYTPQNMDFYAQLEENSGSLIVHLQNISGICNSGLYIFDTDGKFLISSDNKTVDDGYLLSNSLIAMVDESDNTPVGYHSDLNGFFDHSYLCRIYPLNDTNGKTIAVIVVASDTIGTPEFTTSVTQTLVTVSLWLYLAALICAYFVSKRISDPLVKITAAAKNYSKGKFDHRIEVVGQDEIAELGATMNTMAISLERIEENRNSFLANISHDLRTPMTTIAGFVDGILDGTIPPEKQAQYLQTISGEVRRLARLVNTLLQISRMEAGTNLKMSEFNLSEKARNILISFEKQIDKKKLEIEFINDDDVFVKADNDSIHQVIYNLMDNAIKFTPEGGAITVAISSVMTDKKTKKAMFSIKNTGDGIPESEIPMLFERFYKTDRSRGLDKTGTGLGLYIVKTTLRNHGEDITVASKPGELTEFSFMLPLAK